MANRMDVERLLRDKGNKAAEELVSRAADDQRVLAEVVTHATSSVKRVKNGAAKTLKILSEVRPDLLVSRLQDFIQLMDAEDTIVRWIAMDVVGNLAELDRQNVLNMRTLRVFLARISDPALVTAAHAVDNLGKIGLCKPRFRKPITEQLLQADAADRAPDCREILAGKALVALSLYVDEIRSGSIRAAIAKYAVRHRRSDRPGTGKKAEKLLARLDMTSAG
jgi:hypothetical protein